MNLLVAAMLDLLLLIPSPEANEKYTRNFPPYYYVCDNKQTLVSRLEYEDQLGTGELLSVYPYPIEERQQVLWITKGRQYIVVDGQEHDCKSLGSPRLVSSSSSSVEGVFPTFQGESLQM